MRAGMKKNDLNTQKEYFELFAQENPTNEAILFALAQVLRELGREEEANRTYDRGIALLDRLWLPRLFTFGGLSGGLALVLWVLSVRWLWILVPVALLGPALWVWVRRNRHYWLPQAGFSMRQQTVERVDLAGELLRIREMKAASSGVPRKP
jgi:hypothetical protein